MKVKAIVSGLSVNYEPKAKGDEFELTPAAARAAADAGHVKILKLEAAPEVEAPPSRKRK